MCIFHTSVTDACALVNWQETVGNDTECILLPVPGSAAVRTCNLPDGKYMSAIDEIRVFCGHDADTSSARTIWRRVKDRITTGKIAYHQFPGERQTLTPVINADAAIELVWLLPGKVAKALKEKCIDILRRHFGGDASLAAETAANAVNVPAATREFLAPNTESNALKRKHEDLEILDTDFLIQEKKEKIVDVDTRIVEKQEKVTIMRLESAHTQIELVKKIRLTMGIDVLHDVRERAAFKDYADRVLHVAIGKPMQQQPAITDGSAAPRASDQTREISIPLIVARMKLVYNTDVSKRAAAIGRKMATLYRERHGANVVFPKRRVLHNNRPVDENAYTEADADLMINAIKEILHV